MVVRKNGDDELAKAEQEFAARQQARDADSRYIQEATFGSQTAAVGIGDQAKAALKNEQALKRAHRPPKHRK